MADTSVELVIGGMHCASCAALIEETLADHPAVTSSHVGLDTGQAVVTFDSASLSVRELCTLVAEAGYSASPLPAPT